jgi:hypothetical protein
VSTGRFSGAIWRLLGLCFLIGREIGHGDADSDWNAVAQLAGQLDYTQEQLTAALQDVAQSYAGDRGAALLRIAFTESTDL